MGIGDVRAAGLAATVAVCAGGLTATEAEAAGFAIREQSPTAQGASFAGATAAAEDESYLFFNPASIAFLDGTRAQLANSLILPEAEFELESATTALGVPITGKEENGGQNAFVPALYGMISPTERLRLGLGITAPFGLETDYSNDFVGRYHAVHSELRTVNINPVVAYKVTDRLAIGGGFVAQYADAELSSAVDFRTIAALNGFGPADAPPDDGQAETEGDDWGFGFTLGAIAEPIDGTRIGIAYRSKIEQELEGNGEFKLSPTGQAIAAATGAFQDSPITAEVEFPATASIGIAQRVTDRLTLLGEVAWTDWSSFEELRIRFDNPLQPDSLTLEEFEDTVFAAIGARYQINDQVVFRTGFAFDEGAVSGPNRRTPRIPDTDRYWLSAGATYQPTPSITINFGYTHIFLPEADVEQTVADDMNNLTRGNLIGSYKSDIDIFALSGSVRF